MEYLIDTHVIIWALSDKKMLSPKVISILENPATKIFISPMSFFEIAIKLKVGKLPDFAVPLSEFINSALATGFELLPIKNEHFFAYSSFDFSADHRDPFDRYLAAAAYHEDMSFITKDSKFSSYVGVVNIAW